MGSNLSDNWSQFYDIVNSTGILQFLGIIGIAIVVLGLLGAAFRYRSSKSVKAAFGGHTVPALLLIGAFFCMPSVIIPALLWVGDWLIDIVIKGFEVIKSKLG